MVQGYVYILSATPFIKGVAKILEAIIQKGFSVQFFCENKEKMKQFDTSLWTYSSLAFLPHATEDDQYLEQQKILLTTKLDNLNNATVLVALHTIPDSVQQYQRFVSIFDTSSSNNSIQERINALKALNIPVSVFEEIGKTWKSVNV